MADNKEKVNIYFGKGKKIECWDYIDNVLGADKGFYIGSIIRCIAKYDQENGLQELKDAKAYLDRLIMKVEKGDYAEE